MSQSQTCHITVTAMRRKVVALGPRLPWNKEELLLELAGKLYVLASSLNQNRCGLYNGNYTAVHRIRYGVQPYICLSISSCVCFFSAYLLVDEFIVDG